MAESLQAVRLLELYSHHHNTGVRTGDFGRMLDMFRPDAVLSFPDFGIGPLRGSGAIRQAFAEMPPTEELRIRDLTDDGDSVSATYAWEGTPDPAGTLELVAAGGRIARLTVRSTTA